MTGWSNPRKLARISQNRDNRAVRRVLAADERPLHWVGSSKRDVLGFPAAVKEDMGNALGIAQFGGTAPNMRSRRNRRPASGRPSGMSISSPND